MSLPNWRDFSYEESRRKTKFFKKPGKVLKYLEADERNRQYSLYPSRRKLIWIIWRMFRSWNEKGSFAKYATFKKQAFHKALVSLDNFSFTFREIDIATEINFNTKEIKEYTAIWELKGFTCWVASRDRILEENHRPCGEFLHQKPPQDTCLNLLLRQKIVTVMWQWKNIRCWS